MEFTNKEENYKFDPSKEYTGRITLDSRVIENDLFPNEADARLFKKSVSNYKNYILRVCKYLKLDTELGTTIVVNGDNETFIGPIRFSVREYLYHILDGLAIARKTYRDPNIEEIIKSRIQSYSETKDKYDLRYYYPRSYDDYKMGIEAYNRFDHILKDAEEGKIDPSSEIVRRARREKDIYFKAGARYAPTRFVEEQTKLYTSYLVHLNDVAKYIRSHHLNGVALKGIDTEKFELYVAWEYMKMAESLNKAPKLAKEYYNQVGRYLAYHKGNIEFTNSITGEVISTSYLYEKYVAFSSKVLNYVILPEGKTVGTKKIETEGETPKKEDKKVTITPEEKEETSSEKPEETPEEEDIITKIFGEHDPETIEKLTGAEVGETINNPFYEANKIKILFYKDTPILRTAVGVKLNKGYTAFVYPNGVVVLDVISSIESINEAIGNGVYVIHAKDFFVLSALSKKELRSLTDKRKFYYHTGQWQERVSKEIDKDFGEEEREDAQKLIRILDQKTRSKH